MEMDWQPPAGYEKYELTADMSQNRHIELENDGEDWPTKMWRWSRRGNQNGSVAKIECRWPHSAADSDLEGYLPLPRLNRLCRPNIEQWRRSSSCPEHAFTSLRYPSQSSRALGWWMSVPESSVESPVNMSSQVRSMACQCTVNLRY